MNVVAMESVSIFPRGSIERGPSRENQSAVVEADESPGNAQRVGNRWNACGLFPNEHPTIGSVVFVPGSWVRTDPFADATKRDHQHPLGHGFERIEQIQPLFYSFSTR